MAPVVAALASNQQPVEIDRARIERHRRTRDRQRSGALWSDDHDPENGQAQHRRVVAAVADGDGPLGTETPYQVGPL